jgi:ribosomal protein S18 acetylase RimI-like enzyme
MRIEDYDAIYSLWESTSGVGLSEADSRENLESYLERNPGQSFVCKLDGAVVGAILCGNDGRRAFIHHAVVAAGHRRHGVAAELVRLAIARQAELGIAKCHLLVRYNNQLGKAFWKGSGFFEREDLVVMTRDI